MTNPRACRVAPLAAVLLACSPPSASDRTAPKRAALTSSTPAQGERTFEAIPRPEDLIAAARAGLADPVDEATMREVEQELGSYQYQPAAQPEPAIRPAPPLGRSAQEDAKLAAAQARQLDSGTMDVLCTMRPCLLRGDFDGDGRRDVAIQIAQKSSGLLGVGFLLTGRPGVVLAAGRASDIGDDILWADTWSVAPGTSALAVSDAAAAAGAVGAVIVLNGGDRRGVAFFGPALKGGTPTLRSAVVTGGATE